MRGDVCFVLATDWSEEKPLSSSDPVGSGDRGAHSLPSSFPSSSAFPLLSSEETLEIRLEKGKVSS